MRYRERLPQLDGGLFLTDGGIETTLIFHEGHDLPEFAAFDLLKDRDGTEALRRYYEPYAELARARGTAFVLESPTWRASPHWAELLGYSREELDVLNRRGIELMENLRDRYETASAPIVISGCVGPQADAYRPEVTLSADAAQEYHSTQLATFADTAADMVTALTLTYAEEAVGITRAATAEGLPAAISFTVETDGRLPSGQDLADAIRQVDEETGGGYCVLHGELRAPGALPIGAGHRRALGAAFTRPAGQRVHAEPRRARCRRGARRGRSRRARCAVRGVWPRPFPGST